MCDVGVANDELLKGTNGAVPKDGKPICFSRGESQKLILQLISAVTGWSQCAGDKGMRGFAKSHKIEYRVIKLKTQYLSKIKKREKIIRLIRILFRVVFNTRVHCFCCILHKGVHHILNFVNEMKV